MAANITNFNQAARDQQAFMIDLMRSQCPRTAALSDRIMPVPAYVGGPSSSLKDADRRMFEADRRQAENSQALSTLLIGACNDERAEYGFPPFMQLGR